MKRSWFMRYLVWGAPLILIMAASCQWLDSFKPKNAEMGTGAELGTVPVTKITIKTSSGCIEHFTLPYPLAKSITLSTGKC
jgi:hypothetical protein